MDAILTLATMRKASGHTFHVGSDRETPVRELLEAPCGIAGYVGVCA